MKLCYAHDFRMIKDKKGNVYSKGSFTYTVWKRYLKHFEQINVVARESDEVYEVEGYEHSLSLSSGKGVCFFPVPNLSSIKGKITNTKKAKKVIEEQLKKSDALVARLPSEVGKLAIRLAKKMNIPYLIELVGCPYDAYRYYGNIKGLTYAPISMYETKRMILESRYTIYVTKHYLQKRYPTKGKHTNISNVNTKILSKNKIKSKINLYNNLDQRKLRIGMIGSLDAKYKGFDKAIEYLGRIRPNSNSFEIRILGGGDTNNFSEIINKSNMDSYVFFDGIKTSGEGVFNWLDTIDLYIHPSLTEGLPRALIEALSRGCLAIGSNRGGIPELLDEEFLFNPLDFNSFQKSINNVLEVSLDKQIYNNIERAKQYTAEKLELKRDEFFSEFINDITKRG